MRGLGDALASRIAERNSLEEQLGKIDASLSDLKKRREYLKERARHMEEEVESLKPEVFISYARADERSAAEIWKMLNETGFFRPWWDKEKIKPGYSWREWIEEA